MNQDEFEPILQSGQAEVEEQRDQKAKEKALVEAVFRKALAEGRVQRADLTCRTEPPKATHWSELEESKPGEPLAEEWNTYCRQIGRLLAEGHEGRHLLIKGSEIIGIFADHDAAYVEGLKRYFGQPFFVHEIRVEEPYLRIRGINMPWPSSLFRSQSKD